MSYLLGQYGNFSEDVITNYMLQILRGLAYLHESHVLHRDLKGKYGWPCNGVNETAFLQLATFQLKAQGMPQSDD